MLGIGKGVPCMRNSLGNRIGNQSARTTTLGSSACICWLNRIRVGFLFRPSFLLFIFIFLFKFMSYMARDHAES